jgi:hypothetical protein
VQLFVNGSADPSIVKTIQLKLQAISQSAAEKVLVNDLEKRGSGMNIQMPIDANIKLLYNPDSDSKYYMIPA